MEDVEDLATFGPRESVARGFTRAARFVEDRFRSLGFAVERQYFDLPAGRSDGTAVEAGRTFNVIATTQGLRKSAPRLVVGAHLDTVPDSPGANDNASGVAVMLELARLAAAEPLAVPVVFVAFSAEERRRQSPEESVFAAGSKHYVTSLPRPTKAAIRGMINVDMVGNGGVRVMGRASAMTDAALAAARSIDVSARRDTTFFYSDHLAFELAQIPSVWLWTGDNAAYHSPADVASVVRASALKATGRVAWATVIRARA